MSVAREETSKRETVMSVKEICLVLLKCLLVHHTHHRSAIAGCATSSLFPGSDGAARNAAE